MDAMDVLHLFLLNPVVWIVAIVLAIRSKRIWVSIVSGVVVQIVSLFLLGLYLDMDMDINLDEILLLTAFAVLAGLVISVLAWFLFTRVRQRKLASD